MDNEQKDGNEKKFSFGTEDLKKEYAEFLRPFKTKNRKEQLEEDRVGLIEVLGRDVSVFQTQLGLILRNEELLRQIQVINIKPQCYLPARPAEPELREYKKIDFLKFIFSPYKDMGLYSFSLIAFPFRLAKAMVLSFIRLGLCPIRYVFLFLKNLPLIIGNGIIKIKYRKRVKKWAKENAEILSAHDLKWENEAPDRAIKTMRLNEQSCELIVKIQFLESIRKKLNSEFLEVPKKYNFLDLEKRILECLENKEANNFCDAINSVKVDVKLDVVVESQRQMVSTVMYNLEKTRAEVVHQIQEATNYLTNVIGEESEKTRDTVRSEAASVKSSVDSISSSMSDVSSKMRDISGEISDLKSSINSMPSSHDVEVAVDRALSDAKIA